MKILQQALAIVLLAAASLSGRAADAPTPTIDTILQRVIDHAKAEAGTDRAFEQNYSYSRSKITEFHGSDGSLKKRDEKDSIHQPNAATVSQNPDGKTVFEKNETAAASDTHSNVRGQAFKKNDFLLNADLINRFKFTLTGTETLNGRPTFIVDFVPAKNDLPENNLKDRFINKAAGRVWVDAQDYAVAKADLHLTKPVDVAWGLVGSVWKFNYGFDRARTEDGYWFTQDVNWHLEGREVVVNRVVDYHESMSNLQKVSAVAVAK